MQDSPKFSSARSYEKKVFYPKATFNIAKLFYLQFDHSFKNNGGNTHKVKFETCCV